MAGAMQTGERNGDSVRDGACVIRGGDMINVVKTCSKSGGYAHQAAEIM
jgi:hypothetical protein